MCSEVRYLLVFTPSTPVLVKSKKIKVLRVTLSMWFIDVSFNMAISAQILNNLMNDPSCMKYYF
jgi:hypothetical protein